MLQVGFAQPTWTVWFSFPYTYFPYIYLVKNIEIDSFQFLRHF